MNKYTCIRWMSAHICMFSYKKSILPSNSTHMIVISG